jgi:hypothetical protein
MRKLTLAYANTSSQVDSPNGIPSPSTNSTSRASTPDTPPIIDLTPDEEEEDIEMQDCDLTEKHDGTLSPVILNDSHPFLRFSRSQNSVDHWSRHATIQHANMVYFSFRHFAIPEDREALEAFLNSLSMEGSIAQAARCLSELFEEQNTVTVTMKGVSQLESLWMRNNCRKFSGKDYPVRARILFHTYLQSDDWQLVRRLSCVTSSQGATEELLRIAGKAVPGPLYGWSLHRCQCLMEGTQSLRSVSGKVSMIIATKDTRLRLKLSERENDGVHLRWVKSSLGEELGAGLDLWASLGSDPSTSTPKSGLHHSDVLMEVLSGTCLASCLPWFDDIPSGFGQYGAIVLKKSSLWPASCPTFCCLVFDQTNFDDELALGDKIVRTCNAGDLYAILPYGCIARTPSVLDTAAIDLWTQILMMLQVPDAEWPL